MNIWSELYKIDDNDFLLEMSFKRDKALSILKSQQSSFIEHFMKICIFKDITNDKDNWEQTLANICFIIANITTKSASKKLKVEDYKKHFFDDIANDKDDIRIYSYIALNTMDYTYRKLINFKEEDFINYFNAYTLFKDILLIKFYDKTMTNVKQYKELINKFFIDIESKNLI